MSHRDAKRLEELVAGLREAADFLEAHPQLPIPQGVRMYAVACPGSRQIDRFAAVHDAAEAMNVPVTVENAGGRGAKRVFGPVELTVFASADERTPVGTVISRREDVQAVTR